MRIPAPLWALLFMMHGVAGCLTEPDVDEAVEAAVDDAVDDAYWAAVEAAPHEDVTFTVLSRAGGEMEVAGYAWWPAEEAETVVLAVHGSGGRSLWLWGPLDWSPGHEVPGYSFGHRTAASGRAMVSIDLPGYGRSQPFAKDAAGHEDFAFVMSQVADALRSGAYGASTPRAFPVVIGAGISMGGHLVLLTQGMHAPFDAIVPIAWGHGGRSEAYRACAPGEGECPDFAAMGWVRNNTDPRVWAAAEDLTMETDPRLANYGLWAEDCLECEHAALGIVGEPPALEDTVEARIEVPVLMLQGKDDYLVAATSQEKEEQVLRSAEDLTAVQFENTGHVVFHHLSHEDVYATMLNWLDDRGW